MINTENLLQEHIVDSGNEIKKMESKLPMRIFPKCCNGSSFFDVIFMFHKYKIWFFTVDEEGGHQVSILFVFVVYNRIEFFCIHINYTMVGLNERNHGNGY